MQFVQGLPLLILMFICYYAPALLGYNVSAIVAASIALTINASAFLGAIWESALRAIPAAVGKRRRSGNDLCRRCAS